MRSRELDNPWLVALVNTAQRDHSLTNQSQSPQARGTIALGGAGQTGDHGAEVVHHL